MERVYTFLKENINDSCIVVGVSGGVDSMVLLSILRKRYTGKIVCAHVHHNLRLESDEELEFVKEFCRNNDIIFEFKRLEYEGKFSEEVARTKRYNFFEEILNKYNSKTLLTAHHGDDLIETIIMKIVRGSTIKGYSGIEKISMRETYRILRPLLFLTKEEIYDYANKYNVPYREDYTNSLDDYTRNRYRKYLLPFIKEEKNNVHLKFLDYSEELLAHHKYVNSVVDNYYNTIVKDNKVSLLQFMELEEFIKRELLKKYLFKTYENEIVKINNNHLDIILKFLKDGITNSRIDMPSGYQLAKEYDYFILKKESFVSDYYFELKDKIQLPNGKTIEFIDESNDNSNFTTRLDLSEIELPLYVRNYQPADKIMVKNMLGHKKVSDIFTDEKINFDERKRWPVVLDNAGKIIWLPGLKKTHFDRKNTEKYDIILKYY